MPLAGDEYLPGEVVFLPRGVVPLSALGVVEESENDCSCCFFAVTADAAAGVPSWDNLGEGGGRPFRGDMV